MLELSLAETVTLLEIIDTYGDYVHKDEDDLEIEGKLAKFLSEFP